MIDLDDASALAAGDPGGMLRALEGLAEQCARGYETGTAVEPGHVRDAVDAIVVCGMGSSAVPGEAVGALFRDRLPAPLVAVRDSVLPAFCGPRTLVVGSSYSGGTAETLAAVDEAIARGCPLLVVTSGGGLAERAAAAGAPAVLVPGGLMPRAAVGYMTLATLGALERIGVVPSLAPTVAEAVEATSAAVGTLAPDVPTSVNEAKQVASWLVERIPVVWGAEGYGAVAAARWKTELNENAKVPAFASALPELDHNEIVGWSERMGSGFAILALRHEDETADVAARFPLSLDIARDAGATCREVWARGATPLSRLLTLVAIGGFASAYLGIARGVDPTPIDVITRLKRALADA